MKDIFQHVVMYIHETEKDVFVQNGLYFNKKTLTKLDSQI